MSDPAAHGLRIVSCDCTGCAFQVSHLQAQRCMPGDRCVQAMSGRQIDRFFRANPDEAETYLADAFWERRAIAVRYAPLARIGALMADPDEVVRRVVAGRVPLELLAGMVRDTDRDVRAIAVQRLEPDQLNWALKDPDYVVRMFAVRRVSTGRLKALADDPEREVRKVVAARLAAFALFCFATDPEAEVRRIATSRMLPGDAARMLDDPDWSVRLAATGHAPLHFLVKHLETETDIEVRQHIMERLASSAGQQTA